MNQVLAYMDPRLDRIPVTEGIPLDVPAQYAPPPLTVVASEPVPPRKPPPADFVRMYGVPCHACSRPAQGVLIGARIVVHVDPQAPHCDLYL